MTRKEFEQRLVVTMLSQHYKPEFITNGVVRCINAAHEAAEEIQRLDPTFFDNVKSTKRSPAKPPKNMSKSGQGS